MSDLSNIAGRMVDPRTFGLLVMIYGAVLMISNYLVTGDTGSVAGFSLIAIYGLYALLKSEDRTSWGRFKFVTGFIFVFGLSYLVKGIMGSEGIGTGLVLCLFSGYILFKVIVLREGTGIMYTLAWLVIVVLLAVSLIGMIATPSAFWEGNTTGEQVANLIAGVLTFIIVLECLIYYVLFCRTGQMAYECEHNIELESLSDAYTDGADSYTPSLIAERIRYSDKYTPLFVEAMEKGGYNVSFDNRKAIESHILQYFPEDLTYRDMTEIADSIAEASSLAVLQRETLRVAIIDNIDIMRFR